MPASTWRYLGILQEKEERGETNREGEEEKEDKEETWLTVFSLPNRSEATREEMRDAKLPIPYRDSCANLLIPLNRCRVDTYYLPWKCEVRAISISAQSGRSPVHGDAFSLSPPATET